MNVLRKTLLSLDAIGKRTTIAATAFSMRNKVDTINIFLNITFTLSLSEVFCYSKV